MSSGIVAIESGSSIQPGGRERKPAFVEQTVVVGIASSSMVVPQRVPRSYGRNMDGSIGLWRGVRFPFQTIGIPGILAGQLTRSQADEQIDQC